MLPSERDFTVDFPAASLHLDQSGNGVQRCVLAAAVNASETMRQWHTLTRIPEGRGLLVRARPGLEGDTQNLDIQMMLPHFAVNTPWGKSKQSCGLRLIAIFSPEHGFQ